MGHADELNDIFGVPTDGSNIDTDDLSEESQEGAYASVTKSFEESTFDEKAKVVNEVIATMQKSSPENSEIIEETSNEQREQPETTPREEKDFESIISDAKNAIKIESGPSSDEQVEESESDNSPSYESDNSEKNEESNGSVDSHANESEEESIENKNDPYEDLRKAGFLLDPPSRMFDHFYEMKRKTLKRHLPNGKRLPIDKWTQEMHDAYVSIRINLNDRDIIADRMQSIQQKRDRVVQIKSIINSQYFLWKRLIPMMHGQLARVIYEKPAAKQEGINYEHMRDMEEYYNELEGSFETSKDILNNLDAAYDSLSRQVTLTGIGPSPDKFGSTADHVEPQTMPVDNDGFDSLDDNSVVKVSQSRDDKPKKEVKGPEEISF